MSPAVPVVGGIDPGVVGGIAAVDLDGDLVEVWDIPTTKVGRGQWVSPPRLRAVVFHPDLRWQKVGIEFVRSMPSQGVASTFKFGDARGVLRGSFGMRVMVEEVTPQAWKAEFGIETGKAHPQAEQKEAARQLAIERWGVRWFKRKKDAGRAEAALIAEYTRLRG